MSEHHRTMQGKVCLITGATRGLGQAAALELTRLGADVVIVGRSPARVDDTLARLREASSGGQASGIVADLSLMSETRRAAEAFLAAHDRLDVLINNVGATLLKFQLTAEGHEMSWALNYLSHFLLTHLLLDTLKTTASQSGEARIIEVTSSMYRFSRPELRRLQGQRGYSGALAYAQSKRAMMLFTHGLSGRLQGTGVTINAVTPGPVKTNIATEGRLIDRLLMRVIEWISLPLEMGVQPIVHLAAAPELRGMTGAYFNKFRQTSDGRANADERHIRHLWEISEQMTGVG